MACCAVDDNQTKFDEQLAISLTKYSLMEWDERSKACGPSHSSCSGSAAACSASCSTMQIPGLSLKGKDCWADWDDKTTNPSPRSSMSLCDEAADNDLADYDLAEDEPTNFEFVEDEDEVALRLFSETSPDEDELGESAQSQSKGPSRLAWADLVDSEDETASIQANTSDSEDEDEQTPPSPSNRASRRTAARARADTEELRSGAVTDTKGVGAAFTSANDHAPVDDDGAAQKKGFNKGTGKANGKGADKTKGSNKGDSWKGSGKGADKGTGKGYDKSSGKGSKGYEKGSGKDAGKGKTKGKGKGKAKGKGDGADNKFQCQIIIGIEEDSKFRAVRRLIGAGGINMKNINDQSGARLRLRGRGSKFLEGDEQQESTDDLMLCVTADDKAGYDIAKDMATELIEGIQNSYRSFCRARGKECPDLEMRIHEGYRPGSR